MKRILIVSHALELGGAERSLIGLLEAIDKTRYQVDLFLMRHEGELFSAIPQEINLLPEIPAYTVLARPMVDTLKEGHVLLTAARVIGKVCAAQYEKKYKYTDSGVGIEYSHKYTWRLMPRINPEVEYDLAISFLTPHYVVSNKVRAKKTLAWIHTDYSKVQVDAESELKMWSRYDYIASISEDVTETFLKVFPSLKSKIMLVENILPEHLIRTQADAFAVDKEMPRHDNAINILSIGRYCTAKNFDNVPDICRRLLSKGLDVYWYIIGFGRDEDLIKIKIKECGMENRVILLGKKENPYPYIKACDVYIQPSRYEGKCVSVREAQMLGKVVIITQYATSASQLQDGVDGVIVPLNNQECADGIIKVLTHLKKIKKIIANCRNQEYSNKSEVGKIYQLLEKV